MGSSGEYYIVKSGIISIQGRYLPTKFTNGLAVTKMVAIGGPLLKGNKLIIGPLAATWNGAPILTGFLRTLTSQVLCMSIMTTWVPSWTLPWMHQRRRLSMRRLLMARLRACWSRSTVGRRQQGMSMLTGRFQCTHVLVRMDTVEILTEMQLMTTGWLSVGVLVRKAYPLAQSCCSQQRHPSQLPTGLTSTIVQQPHWMQQKQIARPLSEE